MKLLFITRNFPPQVGGMEQYSKSLYQALRKHVDVDLRINKKGRSGLPLFFVGTAIWLLINGRKYSHIHFGDGVLAPLALWVKWFSFAKVSCTIHALDITYSNWLYQKIVPTFLRKLDKIICVSDYTRSQCVKRGIKESLTDVIPNGINLSDLVAKNPEQTDLLNKTFHLANRKTLVSVGRLIKRKGHAWFISEVMPLLPQNYVLLIAGDGPEKGHIQSVIKKYNLGERVHLLGLVNQQQKAALYTVADLFVMPNIKVDGDAEGFGISIIEATGFGTPCIASRLEGITNAIVEHQTGSLVESGNPHAFSEAILADNFDRNNVATITQATYDWESIVLKYLKTFSCLETRNP